MYNKKTKSLCNNLFWKTQNTKDKNYEYKKAKYIGSNDQNLHYQRRLLSKFYFDLDQCAKCIFISKRRIQKDFSTKEANLLKVLYNMNKTAVSGEIFMDIATSDRLSPNHKSINKYIKHIYEILKDAKKRCTVVNAK